jgi:type IV pilus assembly protein PilO
MDLSLNKLPWYAQSGLFAVISIALAGVFYQFYVSPFNAEMDTRRAQLAALRVDVAKGQATANQLVQFKQRVSEREAQLENLKSNLPEQKDVADLLRRIQTLATQSNLAIRGFKPAPSVTKTMHAEWPIALQLDGTYHNLGMFFDRVSKFSRIINISNIAIHAKQAPAPNSTITAECVATTFVLLDQKAAAPVKKAN